MNETPIKNPAAVALGKLNAGKPRHQSEELKAKRRDLMAKAREVLAHKRAIASLKPEAGPGFGEGRHYRSCACWQDKSCTCWQINPTLDKPTKEIKP